MSIQYTMGSGKQVFSINIETTTISCWEFQKLVVQDRKLGQRSAMQLIILNTDQRQLCDDDQIVKNTQVIVKYLPSKKETDSFEYKLKHEQSLKNKNPSNSMSMASKVSISSTPVISQTMKPESVSTSSATVPISSSTPVVLNTTNTVVNQPVTNISRVEIGPNDHPPSTYECKNCFLNHYEVNCPLVKEPDLFTMFKALKINRVSGQPKDRIQRIKDMADIKMCVTQGFAIVKLEYGLGYIKNDNIIQKIDKNEDYKQQLISFITCSICTGVSKEASLVPCCLESGCRQCITDKVLAKSICPFCSKPLTITEIKPYTKLRNTINQYLTTTHKMATMKHDENFVPAPTSPVSTDTNKNMTTNNTFYNGNTIQERAISPIPSISKTFTPVDTALSPSVSPQMTSTSPMMMPIGMNTNGMMYNNNNPYATASIYAQTIMNPAIDPITKNTCLQMLNSMGYTIDFNTGAIAMNPSMYSMGGYTTTNSNYSDKASDIAAHTKQSHKRRNN
ncbi:hypothetical protein WA158_003715 [Blastocystis sp. Blastoise]